MCYLGYRKKHPKTPPKALERARNRRHPKKRKWKKDYDLRQYGLTVDTYDELVRKSCGVCAACKRRPCGKGHCGQLFIDHNHRTGQIRGLLCIKDSPKRLRALIKYLERSA